MSLITMLQDLAAGAGTYRALSPWEEILGIYAPERTSGNRTPLQLDAYLSEYNLDSSNFMFHQLLEVGILTWVPGGTLELGEAGKWLLEHSSDGAYPHPDVSTPVGTQVLLSISLPTNRPVQHLYLATITKHLSSGEFIVQGRPFKAHVQARVANETDSTSFDYDQLILLPYSAVGTAGAA